MTELLHQLRSADRDAYLATLFAPEPVRAGLAALALYHVELGRIVQRARDPLAAEIRLQWWRDAIRDEGFGEGAPLALVQALRAAMAQHHWPAETLCAMSEARIHDLYADPFPDTDAFDGYCGEVFSAQMQLAALAFGVAALGVVDGSDVARSASKVAGYGGVALGAADAVLREPGRLAAGHTHVPQSIWRDAGAADLRDDLNAGRVPEALPSATRQLVAHGLAADDAMRAALSEVDDKVRAALLPALAARIVLRAADAHPHAPRVPGPLRRQWRLWRAARTLQRNPGALATA